MKRISQRQLKQLQQLKSDLEAMECDVNDVHALYKSADEAYQRKVVEYRAAYDNAYK